MRTSSSFIKIPRLRSLLQCVVVFILLGNAPGDLVLHLHSFSCSNSDMNCSIVVGSTDVCIHGLTPTDPVLEPIQTALLDAGREGPIAGREGPIAALNVTWRLRTEASIKFLNATQVCVSEHGGVNSTPVCVLYQYHARFTSQTRGRTLRRWQYSFIGVELKQNKSYEINIKNHPRLCDQDTNPQTTYLAPGCEETPMSMTFYCIHTGKSWDPHIAVTPRDALLSVAFTASNHSRNYTLLLQGNGVNELRRMTQDVAERIEVNFTVFTIPLEYAEYTVTLKPYFALCGDACDERTKTFAFRPPSPGPPPPPQGNSPVIAVIVILIFLAVLLAVALVFYKKRAQLFTVVTPPVPTLQLKSPRKVLIIYSQDHALFRDIVLHFANFLQSNCNVEVVFDLWQVNNIAKVSHLPWLSQHMEDPQVATIIVCSKGAQAKWRAMCHPSEKVELKEDLKSPLGNMFTPAMNLILGDLRRGSYERYLVVYFDDGSSEADIPHPLKVTVSYKLMKYIGELFFRIHNMERHAPGVTYGVHRMSGDHYATYPHGQELKAALDKFRQWKAKNPDWFEEETGKVHNASSEGDENVCGDIAEGDGLLAYETKLVYIQPDFTSTSLMNVNLQPSATEAVNMQTVPVENVCLSPECDIQPLVVLETLNDDSDLAQGQCGGLRFAPSGAGDGGGGSILDPFLVHPLVPPAALNDNPAAMWSPVHPHIQGPEMSNGLATDIQLARFPGHAFHRDFAYPGTCHVNVNLPQLGGECLPAYDDGHMALLDNTRSAQDHADGGDGLGEEAPLSEEAMKQLMQAMLQRP